MSQSSIITFHTNYSIYIESNIKLIMSNDLIIFKIACKKFQDQIDQLNAQYPDSFITGCLAFGVDAWKKVTTIPTPVELKSGNTLTFVPNMNQRDFLIHICSDRFDVAFQLCQDTIKNFANTIRIEQEVHGFKRIQNRDLSNFIDGTNNPDTIESRQQFGLIPAGQPHENGSYVFTQRWVHHLSSWETQSLQYQEETIGRKKKDSEEIPPNQRPSNSHVTKTQLLDADKQPIFIVRQSLPYGLASGEKGLFFISFSHRWSDMQALLESMFGKSDGKLDLILSRISNPVTGSIYYAPSLEELSNL